MREIRDLDIFDDSDLDYWRMNTMQKNIAFHFVISVFTVVLVNRSPISYAFGRILMALAVWEVFVLLG